MSQIRTNAIKYLRGLARLVFVAIIAASAPLSLAVAQDFSPAYRVDNAVVTYYEIDQMAKLLAALGEPEELAQASATDRMINYRLLKNLTSRTGLEVDDAQIRAGLANLAEDGDVDALYGRFAQRGISQQTVNIYSESQILINSYLQSRGADLSISDDEIVARVADIPDQTRELIVVSEIILPYAEYGGRIPTRFEVKKVRDRIAAGESFASIARERSRSSSAANGGRLSPIPRDALNPQLAGVVNSLPVGGVSQPIELDGAIVLLQYTANQTQTVSLPRDPRVSYIELFAPATSGLAASKSTAEDILRAVDNCDDATNMLNGKTGRFDNVRVASLPSGINLALGRLSTGGKAIYERENGTSVLMLCGRDVVVPEDLQPQINAAMRAQAIDAKARGALFELRNQSRVIKLD